MARTRFLTALIAIGAFLLACPVRAASYVYVAQSGPTSQLHVFDADTGAAVTAVPLPGAILAIAVNPNGNRVYAVGPSDMYVVDPLTFTVIATVPDVGGNPAGVAVNAAGTRAYVASATLDRLSVVDTATNTVIATPTILGGATGVAIHESLGEVYVTRSDAPQASVAIVSTATNAITGSIPVGTAPRGIAITPNGAEIYVANALGNTISIIDAVTKGLIGTVPAAGNPYAVAAHPSNGLVYATNQSSALVTAINTISHTAVTIPIAAPGSGIAVQPDGAGYVWAARNSGGAQQILNNATTGTVVATGSPVFAMGNFVGPATILYTPAAPGSVTATAGALSAEVSFSAPSDGGYAVTSYMVTSNPGGITASGASSPITVPGLTAGTPYTFTVTATNANGTGPSSIPSNEVTPAAPPGATAPGAPINVAASGANGNATVTFDPPASDGGSPILGYTAVATPGGATASNSGSPISFTGLPLGATYTFQVYATNAVGDGPLSSASNGVTFPTTPGPIIASIAPGNQSATITFSPPFDGGSPITGYQVLNLSLSVVATGSGSPIPVTGLTNGQRYDFYIRAVNAVGPGPTSGPLQVIPGAPPQAPTGAFAFVMGDRSMQVNCNPADSDLQVTSYTATSSPGGITGTNTSGDCFIQVDNLTAGVSYTFTVTATSAAGTGPASDPTAPVTAVTVPGAPTAVTAVVGPTQATISFTPPADTGFGTIQQYMVRADPPFIPPEFGLESPIVVTGLTNGQAYTFTVSALNEVGEGPQSAPSNSVTPIASEPTEPLDVRAMGGDSRATVSFVQPTSNGGEPITSYEVTATPGGATGVGSGSPITVNGLTNGVEYTFTVRAVNSVGPGAPSDSSNAVTPAPVFPRTAAYAYVTNFADNLVAVINTVTNKVVDTIAVGAGPSGVAVNPLGTRVYVTNSSDGTLSVIDATNNTVIATVSVGFNPNSVAVNPAGNRVYVANTASDSVSVLDTASDSVIATVNVGDQPAAVAVHPSGTPVYVSRPLANAVVLISAASNTMTGSVAVGVPPLGLVVSGSHLWASNPVNFFPEMGRVPLAGGSPTTFDLGGSNVGFGIAADPVSGRIFMARPVSVQSVTGTGFLSTHDGGSVSVGDSPRGVAVTPSTRKVFVANQGSHSVTVIDSVTLDVLATIPVGLQPVAFGLFIGPDVPPQVPDAPGSVVATAGNAQATVSFTAPFDHGSAITSYTVTASPGGATATGTASPLTVTGLVNGAIYTFTVRATNGVGQGPPSSPSNGVVPRTVPSAPGNVSAFPGNGQMTITFSSPSSNGGAFVSGYTVTCNPGAVTAVGSGSPIIVAGLTNGVQYACSVTATNEVGQSAPSALATGTPFSVQYLLTVARTGAGSGTVSSAPSGIDCGSVCIGAFAGSSVVTLTATPAVGSAFAGWTGACTGTGTCEVAMNGSTSALAIFNIAPPVITSANAAAFTVGSAGTFTFTATGVPAPTLSVTGALPTGVTFSAGTGVLSGTPALGTVGSYPLTITAANGAPTNTTQAFTLTVAKASQTITFANPGARPVSTTPLALVATASSGLAVTFASTTPAVCTVAGVNATLIAAGTCTLTANQAGDANFNAAPQVQVSFNVTASDPPRLGNISTRMQVLTGNDVLIGGFVIGGAANKTVVVRARGPSLIPFGITNALANPALQLVRASDQQTIATNDDWQSATNAADLTASGFAPSNNLEAAILVSLPPGAYTAIVSGAGNATGVGIVEVFEVDGPEIPLANISTRGQVLTGNDVMIGGFVITGSGSQTVVIRARGPSLIPFGITNALANPTLQLVRASDQSTIASNDDWQSAANAADITASGFAPSNSLESAILVTLPPGAYTAIVTGAGGGTGVGIVEVFRN